MKACRLLKEGGFNFLIMTLLVFSGCNIDDRPGFNHAKKWVEHHFQRDAYRNLIEVIDVQLVDIVDDTYLDGEYRNIQLNTVIDVKADYVISKMYIYNGFELNEDWPVTLEARLVSASDDEERNRIRSAFETYTFVKGIHDIIVFVEYVFIDGRWRLSSSNIIAIDVPEGEELINIEDFF